MWLLLIGPHCQSILILTLLTCGVSISTTPKMNGEGPGEVHQEEGSLHQALRGVTAWSSPCLSKS